MRPILALALKDLRLLLRNRGHLFFSFAWPLIIALLFGLVFGGSGKEGSVPVAVVDEDATPASAALLQRLREAEGLKIQSHSRDEAEQLVRRGKLPAAVVIPKGYGEASDRLFHGEPRRLELAVDPARKAEAAMLEGVLTGAAMQSFQELFTQPDRSRTMVDKALADLSASGAYEGREDDERFLGELRRYMDRSVPAETGGGSQGWKPLQIDKHVLQAETTRPRSAFEFTFPQGILWGVIGASLGFALSLVTERSRGTLTRLQMAPLERWHVLAGKALGCFTAILLVEGALLAVGALFFGVRPTSWGLLAVAGLSIAGCFVGLMMVVAVIGRTEQSASGLGWAIMMPLALFGGGMLPLFVMPQWMQGIGMLSPVRWSILALEGALWRGLGPAEMVLPCGVLLAVGVVGFTAGARLFRSEG